MLVLNMDRNSLLQRYNNLINNIESLKNQYKVSQNVNVVAVTKYSDIQTVKNFVSLELDAPLGESKAQSIRDRAAIIQNVSWHFIGRIQSNKLKYIIPNCDLIHSVDSMDIIEHIDKEALKHAKVQNILVQLNISKEEQKGGVELKDVNSLFDEAFSYKNINIVGLMGMAEYTSDESIIEREFETLRVQREKISEEYNIELKELSMGMSGDYHLAIKHGATIIRIGSLLFND